MAVKNNDLFSFVTPPSFSLPKHSEQLYIPLKNGNFCVIRYT